MIKYIIVISVLIGSVIFSQDIIHTEKDSTDDYIRYIEYYRKGSRELYYFIQLGYFFFI